MAHTSDHPLGVTHDERGRGTFSPRYGSARILLPTIEGLIIFEPNTSPLPPAGWTMPLGTLVAKACCWLVEVASSARRLAPDSVGSTALRLCLTITCIEWGTGEDSMRG